MALEGQILDNVEKKEFQQVVIKSFEFIINCLDSIDKQLLLQNKNIGNLFQIISGVDDTHSDTTIMKILNMVKDKRLAPDDAKLNLERILSDM